MISSCYPYSGIAEDCPLEGLPLQKEEQKERRMFWLLSGIRLSCVYRCYMLSLIEHPLSEVYVIHNDADVFVWVPLVSLVGHVFAEYLGITAWQFVG